MTNVKKSDFGRGAFIAHDRVQLNCEESTRAKQAMAAECDINNIMDKYSKSGMIEHVNRHNGQYGDLPSVVDYHDSLNAVIAAKESFATLPAKIRNRFENDPASYLAFVQNEENQDEMVELGLVAKPSSARQPEEAVAEAVGQPDLPLEDGNGPS